MAKDLAVLSNRILLKKTPELFKKLIEELTYKFPNPNFRGAPLHYCDIIIVSDTVVSIPISRTDLIPEHYEIKDKRISLPIELPEFGAELRESQQAIYDDFSDNCIINAKPGFGKTFTALALVSKMKEKTLVIVHTVKLREQWAKEVEKVFGFTPSIIGSGTFETDKPITIANIQTLNKKVDSIVVSFGAVIVDECHHVPSTTFKKSIDKIKARYKIGLSATLTRKDGKGILLQDYISSKVYTPPKENTVDPVIIIKKTDIKIPGTAQVPWATRMTKLYGNRKYVEEVIRMAVTQAERGHIVLVLASRVAFLELCYKLTPNSALITAKTPNREDVENGVISRKTPILYASISIYSEGVSVNEFSCVILATAINNKSLLEQVAGRVNRKNKGGKDPELVDIALTGKTGENQLRTRESFYREEGFKVVYV